MVSATAIRSALDSMCEYGTMEDNERGFTPSLICDHAKMSSQISLADHGRGLACDV
jgi:hypothetical protein